MPFVGSNNILISKANEELIPSKPENWTYGYSFYSFVFLNDEDCHVKINGSEEIFLRAGQGFALSRADTEYRNNIESFVIVEEGIHYNWVGIY